MDTHAQARILALAFFLGLQAAPSASEVMQARGTASVSSPDGRLQVTVYVAPALSYAVRYAGEDLILTSPLGLEFADQPPLGPNLVIRQKETMGIEDNYAPEWGPQKKVDDRGNELTVTLAESSAPGRSFRLIVRAYNNGVAFRYVLPRQAALESFTITRELTGFRPDGDPRCWAADFESFHSHQEAPYPSRKWEEMVAGPTWGVPVVMQFDDSVFAAITEAHLQNWAGMYLGIDRSRLGRLIYSSPPLGAGDPSIPIDVSVEGMATLHLLTEPVSTLRCENTLWAERTAPVEERVTNPPERAEATVVHPAGREEQAHRQSPAAPRREKLRTRAGHGRAKPGRVQARQEIRALPGRDRRRHRTERNAPGPVRSVRLVGRGLGIPGTCGNALSPPGHGRKGSGPGDPPHTRARGA